MNLPWYFSIADDGEFSAGCLWLHLLQVLSLPHCPHTPGARGCGHIPAARTSSGPIFACPYTQWVGPGSADMSMAALTHWSQAINLLRVMWTLQILPSIYSHSTAADSRGSMNVSGGRRQEIGSSLVEKKKWTFRRSQKAHGGITAYTASLYLGLERRLYE